MSTSAVEYQGRLFWADDSLLSLWMHFMSDEVRHEPDAPGWLSAMREHWLAMVDIGGGGGVLNVGFLEFIADDDGRRDVILRLNDQVCQRMAAYGEKIPLPDLQAAGVGCTEWTRQIDSAHVLKVVNSVEALLLRGQSREGDAYPVEEVRSPEGQIAEENDDSDAIANAKEACATFLESLQTGDMEFDAFAYNFTVLVVGTAADDAAELMTACVAMLTPEVRQKLGDFLLREVERVDYMPFPGAFLVNFRSDAEIDRRKTELRPRYVMLCRTVRELGKAEGL